MKQEKEVYLPTVPDRRRSRPRRSRWISALAVTAWVALTGCDNSNALPSLKVFQVTGKVLLADGKPLDGGWITFVPKGDLPVTPSAVIQPDGTFSVSTGGSGEGAPPGEYKIRVEAPQLQLATSKARKKPIIPTKYTDEDSSGLVVRVRAEPNRIDPIVLK